MTREVMKTSDATKHIAEQLRTDRDYFVAWQANIAVAFQDAFAKMHLHSGVHEISNVAAKNFLELFINIEPVKDKG